MTFLLFREQFELFDKGVLGHPCTLHNWLVLTPYAIALDRLLRLLGPVLDGCKLLKLTSLVHVFSLHLIETIDRKPCCIPPTLNTLALFTHTLEPSGTIDEDLVVSPHFLFVLLFFSLDVDPIFNLLVDFINSEAKVCFEYLVFIVNAVEPAISEYFVVFILVFMDDDFNHIVI